MRGLVLAARLARRELRGGLKGFRIFLACLTLGVAAIATVQSVAHGVIEGLHRDGRTLLGGDLALRLIYNPAGADQLAYLRSTAEVSEITEMRAMARAADGSSTLVELKAVDGRYPLYGAMRLEGGGNLAAALAPIDGVRGAVVERTVLDRLGAGVGDRLMVGETSFAVRAVIDREPDRISGASFSLGPRLMIAAEALPATGLIQPGSMVYYQYRLRLPPGTDVPRYAEALGERFPNAGWRVRDYTDATPQLEQTIDRVAMFLTLVGLTALLVGGVGVGNAVKAYLDGRIATIATLKCLGARSGLIFETYLTQILILAAAGTAAGLLIGALAPLLIGLLIAGLLPIELRFGVYPGVLAIAAGFGLLTALTFSLWPLARARDIPAAALFRDLVAPDKGWPRPAFIAATALAALGLGGLAVATADDRRLALWFVLGAAGTLLAFRGAAWLVIHATRRLGRPRRPGLRLALANLHRPGAPTANVVLSLGLGLTVLVAIALIQGNLSHRIEDELPQDAPAFFFIDIQPAQRERFEALVTSIPGVDNLQEVPTLRGRIVAIDGVPAEQALKAPGQSWLLRGDRGITYAATPRPDDEIVAGEWWAPDYAGPPLVSIYDEMANAFGIGVGDRITVNVLGRDIEAQVANLRAIDWSTLGINFVMVFSPQPFAAAPHTLIATLEATPAAEGTVQRAVTAAFPNVTAIRVRDALDTVNAILVKIGIALRSTAGITLIAGTLVLAGAIAAGHRRRVYDAVVLKVLGATRGDVLRAFLLEYGLLGLITAALAGAIGTLAAWALLTFVMDIDWVFLPAAVLSTAALSTAITIGCGFVGTWRALGQKAAPVLRNE